MKILNDFEMAKEVLARRTSTEFYDNNLEPEVRQIIDEVRGGGDAALFGCTLKFDRAKLSSLEVTKEQIKSAYKQVDKELVSALELAAERIGSFHQKQKDSLAKAGSGQLVRPLERVGVYAPGGTASYPSTVLMTAVPARPPIMKSAFLSRISFSTARRASLTGTPGSRSRVSRTSNLNGRILPPTLTPPLALISSMAKVIPLSASQP